jgi:RNA polymerase sigma factor (sigma-70 family)
MNKEDIELIFDKNFTRLYRFFYYKVLSKEKAEDLTSETFMIFVEQIQKRTDVSKPENFLFGVAKVVFRRFLQQKYKEAKFIALDESFMQQVETTTDYVNKKTPEEMLLDVLDDIPEKQREVIKLRLIEKNSLSEICEKLGKNMNYVKTTQKRGLQSLKKIFELKGMAEIKL